MPSALIADDEPLLRAELRDALALAWPQLQVTAEAADGRQAVKQALSLQPDVCFLDVNMPHLDGLAAAQQLRERGYAGEIIFVTAYDQYALKAFDARALDYLVKPLETERLGDTIARLKARLAAPVSVPPAAWQAIERTMVETLNRSLVQAQVNPPALQALAAPAAGAVSWLKVTRGAQAQLVALHDIACLRAVPGYTQLITREGEHLIEQPMKTLQQRLDPGCFVQVHRSAIVNLHFVATIRRERPGHCVVELKHGLGRVEASRAGAELLRSL